MKQLLIDTAYGIGGKAFFDGKTAIPAQDENLRLLLKGLKVGEGLKVIRAWIRGFVDAGTWDVLT